MNWDVFNKLLAEANKLLALARSLYKNSLITELEYAQVESSYQQIKFLFVSAQKELALAELTFRQTLNLPQDEVIEMVNWLPFEKTNIDLDSALKMGLSKRPELKIRELVSYFNSLNQQIARSKDRFRISLTGKWGKLAEDYASEPEVFRSSWMVGLKVSKPLGANTINTSVTKQTTPVGSFRIGEETETLTESLELSLVDRLGIISEEKTARVEFLKAINEEEETEQTVIAEVEKSYANYISSLFQIETSLKKIAFQSRRLQVTEGRMKVNEASIVDLVQAYLDYANEKINYNRALIGYYIALSSLSRACGVESYLSLVSEKPVITAWERFSQNPPTSLSYTPFALPSFSKEVPEPIRTGIQGKIIGVNNRYDMAILNIGKKNGLLPNSKVMVYRQGMEYALLVPTRIDENTSACYLERRIAADFKGLKIGDRVEIVK
jgi:outer membrane protein TolC